MGCIIRASVRASSDQYWGGRHGLQRHHHARYVREHRYREQLYQCYIVVCTASAPAVGSRLQWWHLACATWLGMLCCNGVVWKYISKDNDRCVPFVK